MDAKRVAGLRSYWLEGCGMWSACACRHNARESTVAESCRGWEFMVSRFGEFIGCLGEEHIRGRTWYGLATFSVRVYEALYGTT